MPINFQNIIGSTFYDKTIQVVNPQLVVGDDGWAKLDALGSGVEIKGNVNFSKLDEIQRQYGIEEDIAMTFTTYSNSAVELGYICTYDGNTYKVIRAIPFDSHKLIILTKWLSKSSTSISA